MSKTMLFARGGRQITIPAAKTKKRPIITYQSPNPLMGGGKEIRTPDPLLARQVLYQLSYTPES